MNLLVYHIPILAKLLIGHVQHQIDLVISANLYPINDMRNDHLLLLIGTLTELLRPTLETVVMGFYFFPSRTFYR